MGRIEREIAHGRRIKDKAGEIWGWETPAGRFRAERRARMLIEKCEIDARRKVLEIGCGTCIFTEKMARSGAEITAIDLSQDLLDRARSRRLPPNVALMICNAESMNFPEESFDCVVGISVLHHLDVEKALAEAMRVLRRGGGVAFCEPNMLNPQILVQKNIGFIKRMSGDSPDETAFFRRRLNEKMREHGFSEIEIVPFDFLHPATPRIMIPFVEQAGRIIERLPVLREFAGSLAIFARKP